MIHKILSRGIINSVLEGKRDSVTDLPLVTDLKTEGSKTVAPMHYDKVHIAGQDKAVLKGYSGPLKSMYEPSAFSSSALPGKIALGVKGITKHGQLALDFIHPTRLAWRMEGHQVTSNWLRGDMLPHLKRFRALYENSPSTIQAMVKHGELTASEAKEIEADRPYMDTLIEGGINISRHIDNAYGDTIKNLPIFKQANKWVFDVFSKGVISKLGVEFYKGSLEARDMTIAQDKASGYKVRDQVIKDIHNSFGNYGRQGFLKNRTFQDMSQLVALAPGWEQAELRSDLAAAKQFMEMPVESFKQKKVILGNLARTKLGMAMVALTTFQIANMAMNNGEPTWESSKHTPGGKGHEWDLYVPFGNKGKGYYVSPWRIPAALTATIYDYVKRGRDPLESMAQWAENKLSGVGRAADAVVLGRGPMGSKLVGEKQRLKTAGEELLPIPIQIKDVLKPGAEEEIGKQMLATVTGVQPEAAGVSPEEKARRYRVQQIYELQSQLRHTKVPSERKAILQQINELRNKK